jgi:hypothetical protein
MLIADINSGNVDAADALFLIAFVIFLAVCLVNLIRTPRSYESAAVAAGLALVALAWFVL